MFTLRPTPLAAPLTDSDWAALAPLLSPGARRGRPPAPPA